MSDKATKNDLKKIDIMMKLNELTLQQLESIAIWAGVLPPKKQEPTKK